MVERENRGSTRAGPEVTHTVPAEASGPDVYQTGMSQAHYVHNRGLLQEPLEDRHLHSPCTDKVLRS